MTEEKIQKEKNAEQGQKPTDSDSAQTQTAGENPAPKKHKKSKKRKLLEANVYIYASYNNTIITVTELNGDAVCWASSGSCGFKGTRKATPYAATIAVETAMNKAKLLGVEKANVIMKGIGAGRDQALRALSASGISIESIKDVTAVPHNGCRARKARRV